MLAVMTKWSKASKTFTVDSSCDEWRRYIHKNVNLSTYYVCRISFHAKKLLYLFESHSKGGDSSMTTLRDIYDWTVAMAAHA